MLHRLVLLPFCAILLLPMSALATLPETVQEILRAEKIPADNLAILIQDVERDAPLLAHNTHKPMNPASVMKLVTTYAALQILGADYSWKTEFTFGGKFKNGTLFGDLYIKGHGDPYLLDETLWTITHALRDHGLKHITGDLVIDNSHFNPPEQDPAAFDGKPHRVYNALPSALMYNFQASRISIHANSKKTGVDVRIHPPTRDVRIDNQLKLTNKACRGKYRWPKMNYEKTADITTLRLRGAFSSHCDLFTLNRTISSPAALFHGAFASHWKAAGGTLAGKYREGVTPAGSKPFYVHESRPLSDIIRLVNKHSNNVMTRQLLLTLGAEKAGAPGTIENGRQVIQQWMDEQHIPRTNLFVDNGSGLSRYGRVTATSLYHLLLHAWYSPYMPELVSSMSILGVDGTARSRFREQPLQGMMHLKTGIIDHVRAMAGIFHGKNGRRYIVIMLHNQPEIHNGIGTHIQNLLIEWLDEQLDSI